MAGKVKDYYKLLEISQTAKPEEVKKAYHRLAKKFHPDKNTDNPTSSEERFKQVKEAYETLSNENRRILHDADLRKDQHHQTSHPSFTKRQTKTSTAPPPKKTTTTGTDCNGDSFSKSFYGFRTGGMKFTFEFDDDPPPSASNKKKGQGKASKNNWTRYQSSTFDTDFSAFEDTPWSFKSSPSAGGKKKTSAPPSSKTKAGRRKPFAERPPWTNDFSTEMPEPEDLGGDFSYRSFAWNPPEDGPDGPYSWSSFFGNSDPFFDPKTTSTGNKNVFDEFFHDNPFASPRHENRSGNPGHADDFKFWFNDETEKGREQENGGRDKGSCPFSKSRQSKTRKSKVSEEGAFVKCKHCDQNMSVDQLVSHENSCPMAPGNNKSRQGGFYNDEEDLVGFCPFGRDWRDVHSETVDSIRRDRRRSSATRGWGEAGVGDSEFSSANAEDMFRCPYCLRSFGRRAAARHVPFCHKRTKDDTSDNFTFGSSETRKENEKEREQSFGDWLRNGKRDTSHDRNPSPSAYFPYEDFAGAGNAAPFSAASKSQPQQYYFDDIPFPKSDAPSASGHNSSSPRYPNTATQSQAKSGPAHRIDINFTQDANNNVSGKSSFSQLGPGCEVCQRVYGKRKAPFLCSCGAKKGTLL